MTYTTKLTFTTMKNFKIGLLKETKTPPDKRVALAPAQAVELMNRYPNVQVVAQPSDLRCYNNEEYFEAGVALQDDLSDCDLLIGVKEVKIEALLPNKKYLFFAHVAKKQPHNRKLLQAIVDKGITLLDHEYLTNKNNERLVAFGKWAGIVGAYNGLIAYGKRTGDFELRRAKDCYDYKDLIEGLKKISLKPTKILITGGGRVAGGAMEIFNALGIREVSPEEFLTQVFNEPVVCRLDPWHYAQRKDGKPFEWQYWVSNPMDHISTFLPYAKVASILVASHYWDFRSPHFFRLEDIHLPDFKIKVIADVSCDIPGPIPSTLKATTIAEPFYDFNPQLDREQKPFSGEDNITMMTIDNLPGELPRDASEFFGQTLIDNVIPHFLGNDEEGVVERATIVKEGLLTERYNYLQAYLDGKE
jgi:saccharopine dehydrogenase (NAD+, L-lysine forming)